jgi:hypothetical protein
VRPLRQQRSRPKNVVKRPVFTPREQAVLDKPDGFRVSVFSERGWNHGAKLVSAARALEGLLAIRALGHRCLVRAERIIADEVHVAVATEAQLREFSK